MNSITRRAALGSILSMTPLHNLLAAPLMSSERMPVVFIGHGSPMNAIEHNEFHAAWQKFGTRFGSEFPAPQLILCISAHWLTRGWSLTAMAQPKTIHDFGGFPKELHEASYPAPGHPQAAAAIAKTLTPNALLDASQWGLDHGAWSVLLPMFPKANIPVVQLGMDYDLPPPAHFELGAQLSELRRKGVLILASGNAVHNLRATDRSARNDQAHPWAFEFDAKVQSAIEKGDLKSLGQAHAWGPSFRMSHPTHEHYLPLLHAAGAAGSNSKPSLICSGFQSASISMKSICWA